MRFIFSLVLIISQHTVYMFYLLIVNCLYPSSIKQIQRGQRSRHIFSSYASQCTMYKEYSVSICWIKECIHSLDNSHPVVSCRFLDFRLQNEIPFPLTTYKVITRVVSTSPKCFTSHPTSRPMRLPSLLFLLCAKFAHALEPLCWLDAPPGILSNLAVMALPFRSWHKCPLLSKPFSAV